MASRQGSKQYDRRRRTALGAAVLLASSALALMAQSSAQAVHLDAFELDTGTAGANTAVDSASRVDWETLFQGPGDITSKVSLPNASVPGFLASGARADYALPDVTTFTTGSKDTLPIGGGGWQCSKANNVGDKVDIVNSYATAYIDADGHLVLYYGVEKSSPNGDSNIAVWFLKDGTVDCSSPSGRAVDFTGVHRDGDILLVSAFSNGGTVANVQAYEWVGDDATGALDPAPLAQGQLCGTGTSDEACSVVNKTALNTPWNSPDKNGGDLDTNEFFEGGVDVGPAGADTCFATALANTRSSTSLTATLFDYARFSLPVCGDLEVTKYIDVDVSGSPSTGDVTSGAPVSTWAFSVAGPAPSTSVVCTGTTDTTGALVCTTGSLTGLTPGTYTVTETQKTGFFNSDPGGGTPPVAGTANGAATVSKTVSLGVGGGSVAFGNTCYVAKTFQINTVPTGTSAPSSITVSYSVSGGTARTLALAPKTGDATKWVGTVGGLLPSNSITWSWSINGDTANSVSGGSDVSLAAGLYPTCAVTNNANFDVTPISGFKYKDANNSGDYEPAADLVGVGFTFSLRNAAGTVLQTAVSGADGTYSFANGVPPGTYTVRETQETGWRQTEPAPASGSTTIPDRTVTVVLGQASANVADFGNTPLSTIALSFSNQAVNPGTTTPATQATTLSCTGGGSRTGNTHTGTGLTVGTYTCTVVIVDP